MIKIPCLIGKAARPRERLQREDENTEACVTRKYIRHPAVI